MNDNWEQIFHALGYTRRDGRDGLWCSVSGVDVGAVDGPGDLVRLTARHRTARTIAWRESVGDRRWDREHMLNSIDQMVGQVTDRPDTAVLQDLDRAEQIAMEGLVSGSHPCYTFEQLPLYPGISYGLEYTLEHRAAMTCARASTDTSLVGWIDAHHPNEQVRTEALRNPACSHDALLASASDERVAAQLLRRNDIPADVMDRLIVAESTRYLRSPHPRAHCPRLLEIAVHPSCPDEAVSGLIAHGSVTHELRLYAAEVAWRASDERRDRIHMWLLESRRPGKRSAELIGRILGTDDPAGRAAWLRAQSPRLSRLVEGSRPNTETAR